MIIKELKLICFRNYDRLTIHPNEHINLFFGQNGSGKTNLLEAIHYCSLGKSHRTSHDQPVIQKDSDFASCQVTVQSRYVKQNISVQLSGNNAIKKSICLDQKKIDRFSELMGCLQCVIFSPEDLDLIKGGPSVRRRYLDMMISQINRKYFIALQQYKIGLEQRNAILKNCRMLSQKDHYMLDDFENGMAGAAEIIISERRKMISILQSESSEIYRHISGKENEIFEISYHSFLGEKENIRDAFLSQLRNNRDNDIRLGVTSAGPHRDDLNMTLNKNPMKLIASQGQIRTGALSLKLAQLKVIQKVSGENPVLLLDDVMSELDFGRRGQLLQEIRNFQTFITCTDLSDLDIRDTKQVFIVSSADGKASVSELNQKYDDSPTDMPVKESEIDRKRQNKEEDDCSDPG